MNTETPNRLLQPVITAGRWRINPFYYGFNIRFGLLAMLNRKLKSKNMKSIILIRNTILIFFVLISSCNLLDSGDLAPGITIYKTKGDYFNLVDIGMKGDLIFRTNKFWNSHYNSYHFIEFKHNDTLYTQRYRLVNGYVLDSEADERYDVFINMTHKEHLKREVINSEMGLGVSVPGDTLRKYIIDKDPYTEFYRNKTDVKLFTISDSIEMNEIILKGEIDKYFEKIK